MSTFKIIYILLRKYIKHNALMLKKIKIRMRKRKYISWNAKGFESMRILSTFKLL